MQSPVLSERLPNTEAPVPVFDTCVTWFEDGQLEPLLAQEFDTDLYFDVEPPAAGDFPDGGPH